MSEPVLEDEDEGEDEVEDEEECCGTASFVIAKFIIKSRKEKDKVN